MKRLIDANALSERIQCSPLFKNFGEDGLFIREFILECIEEAQTVDAAEIVRCRDCIFARLEDGKIKCYHTYGLLVSKETDYCSNGKRRAEE